eukprot:gene5321-18568_t
MSDMFNASSSGAPVMPAALAADEDGWCSFVIEMNASMGYKDLALSGRLDRPMRDREDGFFIQTLKFNEALGVRVVNLGKDLMSANLQLRVQDLDIGALDRAVISLETSNGVLTSKVVSFEEMVRDLSIKLQNVENELNAVKGQVKDQQGWLKALWEKLTR